MGRTQREVELDMERAARNRGLSQYLGAGSVSRELLGIGAYEISALESLVERARSDSRIGTATKSALDGWGEDLNTPRIQRKRADVLESDLNVRLYTSTGETFDELEGGAPDIKAGDIVYTRNRLKSYIITQAPELSGRSEIYLSIRAIESGLKGNTPAFSIKEHSANGYNDSVLIENKYAIYNGRETESDSEYLGRLLSAFKAFEACNSNAISNEIRKYRGIGKIEIIRAYRGAGSIAVIIQPSIGVKNNQSILDSIEASLKRVVASGTDVKVKNPILKKISINTVLGLSSIENITQKNIIINRAKGNILEYINSLQIGESVSVREIERRISNADPRVVKIGSSNKGVDEIKVSIDDGFSIYETVIDRKLSSIDIKEDELGTIKDINIRIA